MTYQNYQFTAYAEADLTSGWDTDFNVGDHFTVPAGASTHISVHDNDAFLSGDSYWNENANDHYGQHASITDINGAELGNGGQIYGECYFWVQDYHGNWYMMIQIEQEGGSGEYFAFHNAYGVPDPGTQLYVHSEVNITTWEPDYKCLTAGDKLQPPTGSISGTVFCDVDCDGIQDSETTITKGENILRDGDFELGHTAFNTGGYGAWYDIGHHTGDVIYGAAEAHYGNDPHNGLFELDKGSILCQQFEITEAGTYCLTLDVFDNACVPDSCDKFQIKVNGQLIETVHVTEDGRVELSDFLHPGHYRIDFVSLSHVHGFGPGIDNIELRQEIEETVKEPVKGGVTIKLIDASNGHVIDTTLTDADGNYHFADIPVGDYKIMGVAPDGTEFTIQDAGHDDSIDSDVDSSGMSGVIHLGPDAHVDIDLGIKDLPPVGSLSGRYFLDADRDGLDNDGANGIAGIVVELLDDMGVGTGITTTTGADGSYSFGDLAPGTYGVKFTDPDTLRELTTQDANGNANDDIDSDAGDIGGGMSTITGIEVVADADTPNNDAGVVELQGSLSGRYFCDVDDDAVDTNEPGVADATVFLFRGEADNGGTLVASTQTGSDGSYRFDNLDAADDYFVYFENPVAAGQVGKEFVAPNQGNNDEDDSDVTGRDADGNGEAGPIRVTPGAETMNVDAGIVDQVGSLSGRYFFDADRDGLDNDGANGIDGIVVELLDDMGVGTGITTTTGTDGSYSFGDLTPGSYGVKFTDPNTLRELTTQNANGNANDDIDSDAGDIGGGMSTITGITVNAGADTPNNDAGVVDVPGSLSGRYFCDEDGDNIDNDANNGVAGVTVELLDANGNPAVDADGTVVASVETGADGSYSFANLVPGAYSVKFTDTVSGGTLVTPGVGAEDEDSDATDLGGGMSTITGITVNAGANTPDNDAGVKGTASIGNLVFIDENRNGVFDQGDSARDGVGVTLLNASGVAIATTFTDDLGIYQFTGLKGGEYAVQFEEVDGFDFTTEGAAADADVNNDSDADQATGITDTFTLGAGERLNTIDAGLVEENAPPTPRDDALEVCADDLGEALVLNNDRDADFDMLSIVAVNGEAISVDNPVTTDAGTIVNLRNLDLTQSLVVDGSTAYMGLDIGDTAEEVITYTVTDGNGNFADANLTVTFCGDANTVESFQNALPTSGTYELIYAGDGTAPFEDFAYDIKFLETGDMRFDNVTIEEAYCLDFATAARTIAANGPDNVAQFFGSQSDAALAAYDQSTTSTANGLAASENADLVNWVISQNFEDQGFTGWEVQFAIWELADNFNTDLIDFATFFPGSSLSNVDAIIEGALALAGASDAGVDSFEYEVGNTVGIIVDPGSANDPDNVQPFIVALDWEDFDCLCIDNTGLTFGVM